MPLSNNPNTAYNGFLSGQRNMFLTSSIAMAMAGFSDKFEKNEFKTTVNIFAVMVFLLSITCGLKSASDFNTYLTTNEDAIRSDRSDIDVSSWRMWVYVNYTYSVMMLLLGGVFVWRKMIPM
jgi:hypothetical protein